VELSRPDRKQRDCTCGMQRSDEDRELVTTCGGRFTLRPLPAAGRPQIPWDEVTVRVCRGCWQVYAVRPAQ